MSEEESWKRRELGVTSFDRTFWHPAAGQGNLTGLAVTWRQETGQDGPGRNGILQLDRATWLDWQLLGGKKLDRMDHGCHLKARFLASQLYPTLERMSWWRRKS